MLDSTPTSGGDFDNPSNAAAIQSNIANTGFETEYNSSRTA